MFFRMSGSGDRSPYLRCLALIVSMTVAGVAGATPPEYRSFQRTQSIAPADLKPESEWLEIWAVYVGQGDALLIRLPESMSYDLDGRRERIDIVVDGGPGLKLRQFLQKLYPETAHIEHVVLTHHDSDHVKGLTKLLGDDDFGIESIYHNGLASWVRGIKGFPAMGEQPKTGQVFKEKRGLALLEDDRQTLRDEFLIGDLAALRQGVAAEEFQGVYADFANAIDSKSTPIPVSRFVHALRGEDFIGENDSRIGAGVSFDVLWPQAPQRRFKGWGYTINGNSVTFKLAYGDFSMLFSGDHNDASEVHWLETLDGQLEELESDVLKIPHHGSGHNDKAFFDAVAPVLGIASMGSQGFGPRWKHPSEDVIRWMGGSHRVYSTFIHERRFKYEKLTTDVARNAFFESKHVLIQTDGRWFRVVEVKDPTLDIPSVQATKRGNGTRWVLAGE